MMTEWQGQIDRMVLLSIYALKVDLAADYLGTVHMNDIVAIVLAVLLLFLIRHTLLKEWVTLYNLFEKYVVSFLGAYPTWRRISVPNKGGVNNIRYLESTDHV